MKKAQASQSLDKPGTVAVPSELKKALAAEPKAKAIFDKLAESHRREYVQWIAGAKQPATMQRRLEKMIPMLLENSAQKINCET